MKERIVPKLAKPFGEFIVIVTGVLVALAVDAWVERRQERRLEVSYLLRLEEELRQDSVRIEGGLQFLADVDSTLLELSRLRSGLPPRDSLRLVQGLIPARVRGLPGSLSQSTFDDLRSTGAIRLISDPRVRFGISFHYAGIARRRQQLDTDYTHFPLVMSELLPGAVQQAVLLGTPIPDTLMREALRGLRTDAELDRHIRSRTGYSAIQRYFLNETLTSGDSLLAILRARRK
jgi:hypothetical protein